MTNLELTKEEMSVLSTIPKDDMVTRNTSSKKRSTDGQPKLPEEDINNQITFPAFRYINKTFDFDNSPHRVTTIAHEVKCHPDYSALLKVLLTCSSVLDRIPLSASTIHFIPYWLINVSDSNTAKHQIIEQNQFNHITTIIPIHNIDENTMYSGLKKNSKIFPLSQTSNKYISHLR